MSCHISFVDENGEVRGETETRGNETILSAAVRAGVNVSYGCNNGNCGECVARLEKGEITQARPHDFSLSRAQKLQGDFLMCSSAAQTDLVVKSGEHDALPREHDLHATIRKINRDESDNLAIVSVRPQRSRRLRFIAGQYVKFAFADYEPIECSIASCPCDESQLEFHIFNEPQNDLRKWLFSQARPGQRVELFGPHGRFVFGGDYARPVLFLTHTLGFAPIKSLLEHITAQESEVPVVLARVADDAHPHYLTNLCRSWGDALEQLTIEYIDDTNPDSIAKFARATLVENNEAYQGAFDAYISAPEHLHEPWSQALARAGAEPNRIFYEKVHC